LVINVSEENIAFISRIEVVFGVVTPYSFVGGYVSEERIVSVIRVEGT
jgi:hypothetical protein